MPSLALKAFRIIDLFELVNIIPKISIDGFELATFNMPPMEREKPVEIPLWAAMELVRDGVAALNLEEEVTWLGRVHWRENVQLPRGSLSLSAIPTDFYPKTKKLLHFIKERGFRDTLASQVRNFYREIVERRTHIIAELSFMEKIDVNLKDKLTEEELSLMSEFKEVLKAWTEEVYEDYYTN